MKRYLLFGLLAVCLAGCSSPQSKMFSTEEQFIGEQETSVAPAVEPEEPKPEWAKAFLKALELIGTPKENVAEELGPPNKVDQFSYSNSTTRAYVYEFKEDSMQMHVVFNLEGIVSHIKSIASTGVSAEKAWNALSDKDVLPLYYKLADNWTRSYWEADEYQRGYIDPALFAVVGNINGRLIQLSGKISEPLLKADRKFNATTDRYEVDEFYPNPNASWKDAQIITVLSQTALRENPYSSKTYGDIHYISDEPSTQLCQPANENIDANIIGLWQGIFSGDKADLQIQKRENNIFWGEYTIYRPKGEWKIAVQGVLGDNGIISFKDTEVMNGLPGSKWTLGVCTGKFSDNKLSISGVGTDSVNPIYSWKFTKRE